LQATREVCAWRPDVAPGRSAQLRRARSLARGPTAHAREKEILSPVRGPPPAAGGTEGLAMRCPFLLLSYNLSFLATSPITSPITSQLRNHPAFLGLMIVPLPSPLAQANEISFLGRWVLAKAEWKRQSPCVLICGAVQESIRLSAASPQGVL